MQQIFDGKLLKSKMKSERDWVMAAVDQWDQERQVGRVIRMASPAVLVAFILAFVVVLVGIGLPFHSGRSDSSVSRSGSAASQHVAVDKKSLELAQSRVFGVMRGRQPWSRQRISRLKQDVSSLSSRLGRNSGKHRANGS